MALAILGIAGAAGAFGISATLAVAPKPVLEYWATLLMEPWLPSDSRQIQMVARIAELTGSRQGAFSDQIVQVARGGRT
ncbi:hypothetical protein GCM10017653_49220 [Ancylobacter defluvii]|uniref:Uncharacterized protein n=1 Tax=Ancylobacter defluvii TaxID=1282440 RepID=A0A9W6K141_9HYPH|nr:hypothetical protein GCM10017653_49220 [Ancylobacter defluvii]